MNSRIQDLKIKPGQVCWAAYCRLGKPFIEYRTLCRKNIEDMVLANQKRDFGYMVNEAINLMRAYALTEGIAA